jgi:site-specific DNA-methyltransferase (adenine-specific)
MRPVVAETRRILKPTGSAVFILQPNSEHVGQMRGWLWEFMAWICRDWNIVQDAYWWNTTMPPTIHAGIHGLMRQALKTCVWCGPPVCYRNQDAALWQESLCNAMGRLERRAVRGDIADDSPSGYKIKYKNHRQAAERRGGVTPFNVLPFPNSERSHGHGAGTPLKLADWWTRYICPPGGTVADWFMGSGTMGVAAVQNGCNFIGIEKEPGPGYFETAQQRIEAERTKACQAEMQLPA